MKFLNLLTVFYIFSFSTIDKAQAFEIVSVTEFQLTEKRIHHWSKEKRSHRTGAIIIAKVSPGKFDAKQAQNLQVMVDGEVLEQIDSGQKRPYKAFIAPINIKFKSAKILLTEMRVLPEQTSQTTNLKLMNTTNMTHTLKSSMQKNLQLNKVILANENQLYKQVGLELLKFDPGAKDFISHWL